MTDPSRPPAQRVVDLDDLVDFLRLASLGGARHGLDEAGVVKCVPEAACAVGAHLQIADEMNVDLADVDRRAQKPAGNRGLLRCSEYDARCELEIPGLEAVRVSTGQAEPSLRSRDLEAEPSILRRPTTVDGGRECVAATGLPLNARV